MKPVTKRLNFLIKNARIRRGVSQKELGDYLGYASGCQYVSNFERLQCPVPLHQLKYISAFLDISYKSITKAYLGDKEEEIKTALWGK